MKLPVTRLRLSTARESSQPLSGAPENSRDVCLVPRTGLPFCSCIPPTSVQWPFWSVQRSWAWAMHTPIGSTVASPFWGLQSAEYLHHAALAGEVHEFYARSREPCESAAIASGVRRFLWRMYLALALHLFTSEADEVQNSSGGTCLLSIHRWMPCMSMRICFLSQVGFTLRAFNDPLVPHFWGVCQLLCL